MQLTSEEKQEWLDYIFQHNYDRIEQAAKRLEQKGGQFSMNITFKKEEGLQISYTVPDEDAAIEFALAIARFALPGTGHNVDQWLKFLRDLAGKVHSSEFEKFETSLQQIREGGMLLTLDQEKITDSKAYELLAKGVVFAGDQEAREFKQELLKHGQIIGPLMWEKYYTYCLELWRFLQEVHEYRKKHGISPTPIERETRCIYCKKTAGDFKHVEHIIPESLGNEYIFLPKGFVCGDCMNKLNDLEDSINEMLPFSMAIVTTSIGNKKGKLPKMKSSQLHMQKKSPNELTLRSFGGKEGVKEEQTEEGGHKIILTATGGSGHFDAHRIARILFKAALGAIALEKGRALATYDRIIEDIPKVEGRCLLLSSQAYEPSLASDDSYSLYTKHLIEGLRGAKAGMDEKGLKYPASFDDDGNVTPETLHKYLYHKVANEAEQVPKIKSDMASNIVLAHYSYLAKNKPDVNLIVKEGDEHFLKDEYDEAIECYDRAIEANPYLVDAWHKKGNALYNKENYNEALKCYDRASLINPNHFDSWYKKGLTRRKTTMHKL